VKIYVGITFFGATVVFIEDNEDGVTVGYAYTETGGGREIKTDRMDTKRYQSAWPERIHKVYG
jgi:hypothetical protein